jgi:hypothetical protein
LHKRKIGVTLVALAALVAVVAGCGGGGSSSSSTAGDSTTSGGSTEADSGGAAPSKAAFIKEADKLCSKAEAELSEEVIAYAEDNGIDIEKEEEPSEDQQTEIYEQIVLPNIARQAEELEALTPPAGEEETVEDITSTLTSEVEEAEEDPSNLDSGTLEGAAKKAQAYGLTSCGA